jgi:hypothetical protein
VVRIAVLMVQPGSRKTLRIALVAEKLPVVMWQFRAREFAQIVRNRQP